MDNRQLPPNYHRNAPGVGVAPTVARTAAPAAALATAPTADRTADRIAVQAGMWMRAGFVGANVLAAGLVSLLSNAGAGSTTGETAALAAMVIGGALAWFSWRNVAVLLRRLDTLEAAAAARPATTRRAGAVGLGVDGNAAALATR